ncbi:MAG: YolD-like family protein [Lachnospiraceae bacterium]|nr:YolD-like family protein [Lachnospiraceae bacterium]
MNPESRPRMNHKPRPQMAREERAKQFMPFAALKGYEEALRAKEHIVVEKSELSEEKLSELDEIFRSLRIKDIVTCIYYSKKEENYLRITGILSKIDADSRIIKIVNKSIGFDNIQDIYIQET